MVSQQRAKKSPDSKTEPTISAVMVAGAPLAAVRQGILKGQ